MDFPHLKTPGRPSFNKFHGWVIQIICLCLTCQGYSFTSVSTPPTILVLLLTRPQLQVPIGPEELGVVVIPDPSVVVVSDSSVVVAAVVVVVTTK